MTLIQLRTRSVSAQPVHSTAPDVMDAAGPQVWYDMTVEVALSVMAAARADHLVVCDEDARCAGLVTQARLTAVRNSSGYTDRIRLRDVADDSGPFVSPPATRAETGDAMPSRPPVPVADGHGSVPGFLALTR